MRIRLTGTSELAPLVGCDDTTVRRRIAAGRDGGLAMQTLRGDYVVLPADVGLVVARLSRPRPHSRRALSGRAAPTPRRQT